MVVFNMRKRIPVWADGATQNDLLSRFGYAFVQPKDSPYPPILEMNTINEAAFSVGGEGGEIVFEADPRRSWQHRRLSVPYKMMWSYMPDVAKNLRLQRGSSFKNLNCLIVDALRRATASKRMPTSISRLSGSIS